MCIIAVAISSALLVSLLSVAEGIWQNASYSIESSREDIIIIPDVSLGSGNLWGISNGHKIADNIKGDTVNISEASPMFTGLLKIEKLDDKVYSTPEPSTTSPSTLSTDDPLEIPNYPIVISIGVIPERFEKFLIEDNKYNFGIIEFEFMDWFEISGDPHFENNFSGPWTNEILVDEYLADEYDLKAGSKVNLSMDEPVTFTVAGIFKTNLKEQFFISDQFQLQGIVFLHLSEYQSLVKEDIIITDNRTIIVDNVNTIAISLNSDRPKDYLIDDITFNLQERYPLLKFETKEEQLQSLEEQNAITRVFYMAISLISIIIGLLFVACIMLISVYERTNEIGMLRAIGISRFTIFRWVLIESLLLIIIGIIIGFLPGYFGSEILGEYISNDIGITADLTAFSAGLILWSFFGMLCLGLLISLIPATRASIMRITDAMSFVR
jgi:ABC-type antimicrobial peptide transport system permease subunit